MSFDLTQSHSLLDVIRLDKRPKSWLRRLFFSRERAHETTVLDLHKISANRKRPVSVNPAANGVLLTRNGHVEYTVKPSYFRFKTKTTPQDALLRLAGEYVYDGMTPAERMGELVGQDLRDVSDMIDRGINIQCSEAIFTGKVNVYESVEGQALPILVRQVDWAYPADNLPTCTGTDLWDNASSDPVTQLSGYAEIIMKAGGAQPTDLILSTDLFSTFIHHSKVTDLLDNRRIQMADVNVQVGGDGETYIGHLAAPGLNVDVWCFSDWYEDFDGTVYPLVPAKKAVLGSRNSETSIHYGVIQNLKAMRGGSATANGFVGAKFPLYFEEQDGSAAFFQMESSPLACNLKPEDFVVFQPLV